MRKILVFIAIISSLTVSAKQYKAAEIYSTQSYLYGRFEMRIKSAPGSGQLSTFFLYRNSSETNTTLWQEIDIEIFGKVSDKFQSNVIVEKVEGKKLMTETVHTTTSSLSDDFHTYTLEWTPDSINWFFDGELMRTEKVNALLCNAAMSIRFNHWAANLTSWVGSFDKTILPQYQYVDYISYSSHTPGAGDNGSDYTFQWKDDFDTFDNSRWSKANWTFGENLCDFLPENAYTENGNLVLKLHDSNPPIISTDLSCNQKNVLKVSPNPFTESISITYDSNKQYSITLSTTQGSIIFNSAILHETSIDLLNQKLATLPKDSYIITIIENGIIVGSQTIIKQ